VVIDSLSSGVPQRSGCTLDIDILQLLWESPEAERNTTNQLGQGTTLRPVTIRW
jgi:hypothetical protein